METAMDTSNKKIRLEYGLLTVVLLVLAGMYLFLKWSEKTVVELLLAELMILFGFLAAVSDGKSQRIPNKMILLMLACWMIVVLPQLLMSPEEAYDLVITSLIGFVAGGGITMFAYVASRKGLGGGDVKFCAAAGCYTGAVTVLSGILFGSILALLVNVVLIIAKKRKKTDRFAFVPYINAGILILLFLT